MQISYAQNQYDRIKTSFKMNVKFAQIVSDNNFLSEIKGALSKTEISDSPYSPRSIAKSFNYLFTENICDCSVIGVTNGKKAIMAHLIPNKTNLVGSKSFEKTPTLRPNLERTLQNNINKLKENGEKLKAFLIGGQIYEQNGRRSISLFKDLKDFLKENDIKPTIVWGQDPLCGEMAAIYSIKDDILTLYPKTYDNTANINIFSVQDYFQIMKFNKEDTITINDKKYYKKYLTKENKDIINITKTNIGLES